MPVLILADTGEIDVVRSLAARLLSDGGEVRGYLDDDDHELRNLGCKLAVGALDDELNLEGALTNVHTFVRIPPDPARLLDDEALGREVEVFGVAAASAASARVAQTILVLPPLPDEPSERIEQVFRESCGHLCILKTGFLWGTDRLFTSAVGALSGALPGGGTTKVPVLGIADLVELVAAVDDRESIDGKFEFGGRAYPLARLVKAAGRSAAAPMPYWLQSMLAGNIEIGTSAESEFGVTAAEPEGLVKLD